LLVGNTDPSTGGTVAGHRLISSGFAYHTRDGGLTAAFNRLTSDGSIAEFRKDGAPVGSIGISQSGSVPYIGGTDTGICFNSATNGVLPADTSNPTAVQIDAAKDLGFSSVRWRDLYLSGGVYQSGTRLIKRTSPSSGGSGIFASITNAPQTGFIHIYEIGTNNYAILACTKRDTSSDVVTTVIANNVLTVSATNAGGTVAIGGHTSSGNVKMQATIIREA